jgi:hypothetical protein
MIIFYALLLRFEPFFSCADTPIRRGLKTIQLGIQGDRKDNIARSKAATRNEMRIRLDV